MTEHSDIRAEFGRVCFYRVRDEGPEGTKYKYRYCVLDNNHNGPHEDFLGRTITGGQYALSYTADERAWKGRNR